MEQAHYIMLKGERGGAVEQAHYIMLKEERGGSGAGPLHYIKGGERGGGGSGAGPLHYVKGGEREKRKCEI